MWWCCASSASSGAYREAGGPSPSPTAAAIFTLGSASLDVGRSHLTALSVRRTDGRDPQKAGDRRGRRVREDLLADRVQQGPVPGGIRAYGVRELRRRHRG